MQKKEKRGEYMTDIILPFGALAIVTVLIVLTLIKNPSGEKNATVRDISDIFLKMNCPVCGHRMKKKWIKREASFFECEPGYNHTYVADPVFTCPECGKLITKKEIKGGEGK